MVRWIVDSGASRHMSPHDGDFTWLQRVRIPHTVFGIDSQNPLQASHTGTISLVTKTSQYSRASLNVSNVWLVPGISDRLFSVSQGLDQKCEFRFSKSASYLSTPNGTKIPLKLENGLFVFYTTASGHDATATVATAPAARSLMSVFERFSRFDANFLLFHVRNNHLKTETLHKLTILVDDAPSFPHTLSRCIAGQPRTGAACVRMGVRPARAWRGSARVLRGVPIGARELRRAPLCVRKRVCAAPHL